MLLGPLHRLWRSIRLVKVISRHVREGSNQQRSKHTHKKQNKKKTQINKNNFFLFFRPLPRVHLVTPVKYQLQKTNSIPYSRRHRRIFHSNLPSCDLRGITAVSNVFMVKLRHPRRVRGKCWPTFQKRPQKQRLF